VLRDFKMTRVCDPMGGFVVQWSIESVLGDHGG
jgi:hypothetical protein